MSVVTTTYLKSRFQSGDFPNEQDFIDLIDTLGAGTSYKKYTALLTQTGTDAPVATVLENTLGGTPVWTRTALGVYRITLTGTFTENKTLVEGFGNSDGTAGIYKPTFGGTMGAYTLIRVDANYIQLQTYNDTITGQLEFSAILGVNSIPIEIRVYP